MCVQVTEPNRVDYNGTGREKAHSGVGLARETGTLHREPARGTVCNNVITITFFFIVKLGHHRSGARTLTVKSFLDFYFFFY